MPPIPPLTARTVFGWLTDGNAAKQNELSDTAHRDEPANFLRHIGALSLLKLADGLLDPKLVLSWLLQALGASAGLIGLLVPVREAGALLPQLFISARIRAMGRRKWAWVAGSLTQGAAAAVILLAALTLQGAAAGGVIVAALAVLAVARSVCSVSYKDVLGKTVDRARRGTVSGTAGTVASGGVIAFALVLMAGQVARLELVLGAVALASLGWILAGLVLAGLREEDAPAGNDDGVGLRAAVAQLGLLRSNVQLRRFIVARALLVPTALAPPYLVVMAAQAGGARFQALGAMVLASSLATLVSAYVWGRLADRSSRRVLMGAGAVAAMFLLLAVGLNALGQMASQWAAPLALFGLMIAYQGVRLGRATYLVDMADTSERAAFTAVANTTIGLVLLAAGGVGFVAAAAGPARTLLVFAGLCLCAVAVARRLDEA